LQQNSTVLAWPVTGLLGTSASVFDGSSVRLFDGSRIPEQPNDRTIELSNAFVHPTIHLSSQ
jgi:hypothetical protein